MASACTVYAIVRRDAPLPAVRTERGALELTKVPCGALAAVTSIVALEHAPLTMDAVLHHEAVVEAIRRRGAALPVRFGTFFRDAASVGSALAEQYEPLAADLDRLGDKVELSLTALWADDSWCDQPDGSPGNDGASVHQSAARRYLHARAAELRREDARKDRALSVARALDQMLGSRVLERRETLLPTPRIAVRAAYLLDAAAARAFRAAFSTMRARLPELRLLLTGPWPPYSFVRRAETERGNALRGRFAGLAEIVTEATRGRAG